MKMRKGFTLIELLIVLAIIAALMAVVTPIALNAVRRAKVTNVAENLRNIKAAVESYVYTENQLPTDLTEFDISTLENAGYLSNADLSNYSIYAYTDANEPGTVYVFAYYSGSDIDLTELRNVLPGAQFGYDSDGDDTLDTFVDAVPEGKTIGTDGYVGIHFKVEKWW